MVLRLQTHDVQEFFGLRWISRFTFRSGKKGRMKRFEVKNTKIPQLNDFYFSKISITSPRGKYFNRNVR